jgi:hypothetical protein
METHELLTGEKLSLAGLTEEERAFLRRLARDAEQGTDYFDLLRRVKGPKALPLRGGPITPAIATSVLYRVAHDIADRVGIEQGYLLAPEVAESVETEGGDDLLSLTEAAELIGITRPAAHQALVEKRLRGRRVGNAWVVTRPDAEAFRKARSKRPGDTNPSRPARPARAAAGSRR